VLIDANGVVSLWIDNDWTANARPLLAHDAQWCTEPYVLITLSNVFATYMRHKLLAREDTDTRLEQAEALIAAGLFPVAHRQALGIAIHYGISAYDARFLAVAHILGKAGHGGGETAQGRLRLGVIHRSKRSLLNVSKHT
jgi:predicted nucleic acid-binding protein